MNYLIQLLILNIAFCTSSSVSAPTTEDDFKEKEMEREAYAAIANDLALAKLEESKAEIDKDVGTLAVGLGMQDMANGDIDLAHSEINKAQTMKDASKPRLSSIADMKKKDKGFGEDDLQNAKEMHETAKEDVEVTGKEDKERSKEDQERTEKDKQFWEKMKTKEDKTWGESKKDKQYWDKQTKEGDQVKEQADKNKQSWDKMGENAEKDKERWDKQRADADKMMAEADKLREKYNIH